MDTMQVESFSVPERFYTVDPETGGCTCKHGLHRGPGSHPCRHARFAIAESYGANPPKIGSFVTPADLDYLAELTGVAYFELSSAFTGERQIVAKAVVAAALTFGKEPEEWGCYVTSWSKRFERGKRHRAYVSCPEGAA